MSDNDTIAADRRMGLAFPAMCPPGPPGAVLGTNPGATYRTTTARSQRSPRGRTVGAPRRGAAFLADRPASPGFRPPCRQPPDTSRTRGWHRLAALMYRPDTSHRDKGGGEN